MKQEYKNCIYFCYGKYCSKPYLAEKEKYGWGDLSAYECIISDKTTCPLFANTRICENFVKKSLWQKIKEKIFRKII